ncbi:hypothetical protein ACFWIB_42625 [Streptomyces sp. NPDC127051]|uniref:hypothetical protein n=1 Tax=Streptomyces sp. NPDC127051 TaxID=3347119 RepID=UPI00364D6CB7
MPSIRPPARKTLFGLAASTIAVASLTVAPTQALAAAHDDMPVHQCWVNDALAPPGPVVYGTEANDRIECENDIENTTVYGAGGDDYIRVKGLVTDSQVLGGEGNDYVQTSDLYPVNGSSTVRGGNGDDTIVVGAVHGTTSHGATVYGDMGNDKITTGSVNGTPGDHQRGGGQVFGNDEADVIKTGMVDWGGRLLGGSGNDVIEAKGVGAETGGTIQGGPGADAIRGTGDTLLTVGPAWGVVDGGADTDNCKAMVAYDPARSPRGMIGNCEVGVVTQETTNTNTPAAAPQQGMTLLRNSLRGWGRANS